jgi:hypothetical protein
MESAAGKPTALAKLIGFYTIEIRNLETGVVQSKADVLVTENVFYDRNISKTFDLKVHGCKVKLNMAQGHTFKTLFEGMLAQPYPIADFVISANRATACADLRSPTFKKRPS